MKSISDFSSLEKLLLPPSCHFSDDARRVINCWESKEILACPGSGKTTVLIAKLRLLADHLPLPNGRGVCVLSHTNVAINEIKNKFGDLAYKLLSYPNFVGTIQSFIDRYILFPFLRSEITCSIHLTSDDDYAKCLYSILKSIDSNTYRFIRIQYQRRRAFSKIIDFIKNIYIDDDGSLKLKLGARLIASKDNIHAKNFKLANKKLFENGVIRYSDTYRYTENILEDNQLILQDILSQRFAFVFIDEYQDCSKIQRQIFEQVFSSQGTIFQKIGDINQAIYIDESNNDSYWGAGESYLSIANTNRCSQEIADIITEFQSEYEITSERGTSGIQPTLFVYNNALNVLPSFIQSIKDNNLIRDGGVYKAIGIYQNVSGLKISDYWPQFKSKSKISSENRYFYFVLNIMQALNNGKTYIAEQIIRMLICKLLHITDKKYDDGKYYTTKSIKHFLQFFCNDEYKTYILNLINKAPLTFEETKDGVNEILFYLLGENIFQEIPDYFTQENQSDSAPLADNILKSEEFGLSIEFDTVYGVKGETHDATLYLETEIRNSSDIIRTAKFISNNGRHGSDLYKKNKNCVYVGLSRPRYLLCLAIRRNTYDSYKNFFSKWKIINLD